MKLLQGFSLGSGFLSTAIQHVDRMRIDGKWSKSPFSHTYLRFILEDEDWLAESFGGEGVSVKPYNHLRRAVDSGKIVYFEEVLLTDDAHLVRQAWNRAKDLHGSGYDTSHLLWLYAGIQFCRRFKVKPLLSTPDNKYTCNEFTQDVASFADCDVNANVWDGIKTSSPHSQWISLTCQV